MAAQAFHSALRHVRRTAESADTRSLSDRQLLERYHVRSDEAAFAALVRRHSRLVISAIRQVLTEPADVDDAFQAAFLVVIRKAHDACRQPSIGNWLYTVAHRIAVRARAGERRRKQVDGRARGGKTADAPPELGWREVVGVLHEELDRLPDKFRLPLLLCYLQGQTRDEAAAQLRCKASTIKGRLETGRKRLRARLARRGVELSAAMLTFLAAEPSGAASALLVRAAAQLATGGPPSAAVAAMAGSVSAGLTSGHTKLAVGFLLTAGLLAGSVAGGMALSTSAPAANRSTTPTAERSAATPVAEPAPADESIAVRGRVVGPDGQPVGGAKLYLTTSGGYHYQPFTSPESATTGPDGRFAFTARKARIVGDSAIVSAAAPNLGADWVVIRKNNDQTDVTLRLVADVPIVGQVVDLEGKPVAGASLRVVQIQAAPDEDLGPWLKEAQVKSAPPRNRRHDLENKHLPRYTTAPSAVVTADAAGRFRITGVGRERVATVQLDGPSIASEFLHVRTRPGEAVKVPTLEADPDHGTPQIDVVYYGAEFRHAAGPTNPIVGTVRDKDTKRPLAGITVRSQKLAHNPLHGVHIVRTRTDAAGRYRLVGMPAGAGNKIQLVPPPDLPYAAPDVEMPDGAGREPVTVDVELKRAVWIEGRITDKVTGKPLRGHVTYHVGADNPQVRDYPGFWGGIHHLKATSEDGTYRVIGLPGPGQVLVLSQEGYLLGGERDDEDGLHRDFGHVPASNFAAFARVNPVNSVDSVNRDIALVPGWTFAGTVLGPDGKPLVGAEAFGVYGQRDSKMATAEFTVRQFNPRRPRPVFFRLAERGLVGVAELPKENGCSLTVRMAPGATVAGRLVDRGGRPRAGVTMRVSYLPKAEPHWDENGFAQAIQTDQEGRFRVEALVPGFDYFLNADHSAIRFGDGLRLGETKELGDVRFRR